MNVSAFLGNDELRRQEALEAAVTAWDGGDGTCVRESHFGEDMRWEHVAESYQTQDLFAPRKALIIKNWDKLHLAHQKNLEELFRSDNPTVAVFLSAEKWDGRSSFRKAVDAAGKVLEFKQPYEDKVPQWISQRAQQKYGRRLSAPDARLLQDIVGNNLSELDHELEKLDTFLPKSQPITAADIHDLVSPLKVVGIFEFQRSMGLRRKADMLPALRNLLDNEFKDAGFVIAQRLYSHFLALLKIRAALEAGEPESSALSGLKVPPFIVQKERYLEQAKTRSVERWKQLVARLARLETELKQGRYPHRFEVEMAFAAMV